MRAGLEGCFEHAGCPEKILAGILAYGLDRAADRHLGGKVKERLGAEIADGLGTGLLQDIRLDERNVRRQFFFSAGLQVIDNEHFVPART